MNGSTSDLRRSIQYSNGPWPSRRRTIVGADCHMHSVRYGESTISYSLVRRPRRTLGITVHPDRSVIVSAPEDAGLESIQALVLRRARWILRQQVDLARYEPRATPRQYVSGESYRYLGR